MRYPAFKWVDAAFNGAHNRNKVIEIAKLRVPKDATDCYRTVYRYPDEFKQFFDNKKSVSGYSGPVYADFFPLDIDDSDLTKAHETAKRALNELLHNYAVDLDELYIYFSGAKGFHILIPDVLFGYEPSKQMPAVFKLLAKKLLPDIKIDEVIYDRLRLFRLSNTKHSKTGLYKVPLTPAEVLNKTIDDIREIAKNPRKVQNTTPEEPNEYLREAYRQALSELKEPKKQAQPKSGQLKPPKNAKLCYYKILEGVGEGCRDNAGLRLAVHLLKEYPEDYVRSIMHAWNQRNKPPLEEKVIDKLVHQATGEYDFGCNDSVLADFCDPRCVFKARKEGRVSAEKIYTLDEARDNYLKYIQQLEQRKIMLGFHKLDKHLRGIAPGEVCELIARTGVGKTAFLLNVIKQVIVNQKIPVLFFSLEQPLAQVYERTVQIAAEVDGWKVEKNYKQPEAAETMHMLSKQNYDKLYIVEEDFLTYEELKEFIQIAEKEKIGSRPPLVCVDYLGRMKGGGHTPYEITSELAKLLKVLAKELDIAILYLHQTSRLGKSGAEKISLDMARDSGVTEEAADFIIGMWRPELNSEEAQERDYEEIVVAILKNRKGGIGQASYKFVKPYLKICEWENDALEKTPETERRYWDS